MKSEEGVHGYMQTINQMKEKSDRITFITEELGKMKQHIKVYSTGSFPVFYMQLHSILKVDDILDMRLSDVYQCHKGNVRVKSKITWDGLTIELNTEDRKELAWYVMQRIHVKNVKEEQLDNSYLCVNKQGHPLQKQVYRKMLERASNELNLSRVYNSVHLRSLYGYLEIAHGNKTVDDIAREYCVERYYLLNRTFKGMDIEYASDVLEEVACI